MSTPPLPLTPGQVWRLRGPGRHRVRVLATDSQSPCGPVVVMQLTGHDAGDVWNTREDGRFFSAGRRQDSPFDLVAEHQADRCERCGYDEACDDAIPDSVADRYQALCPDCTAAIHRAEARRED